MVLASHRPQPDIAYLDAKFGAAAIGFADAGHQAAFAHCHAAGIGELKIFRQAVAVTRFQQRFVSWYVAAKPIVEKSMKRFDFFARGGHQLVFAETGHRTLLPKMFRPMAATQSPTTKCCGVV